ncbi:LA2681 family HEPN domain-containing protein [Mucilaginibacter sp. UYCu711]|uniref:LA2681 family HEPN domain-containing protein n=1 Tax=Mucilaginibacter sp. UYCu711 TaxID=3156339 RepID=UPI003D1C8AE9
MLSDRNYAELLALDPRTHSDLEKVGYIGDLFDYSYENNDTKGTEKGLSLSETVKIKELPPIEQAKLHYYLANGWSQMRYFNRFEQSDSWDYDQVELTGEIFHLRSCLRNGAFDELQKELRCQAYTNMGNHFSHVGRFVEAQQMWRNALEIIPHFGMALGNMGQGYFYYGRALYDNGHHNIFIFQTYQYLIRAIQLKKQLHPGAYDAWKKLSDQIAERYPATYLTHDHDFNRFDLGKDPKLRSYRRWCLDQYLYINPLNDIGPVTTACHDILHLPSMTVAAGDPPKYHTLFNQIKQEYATARFLFYEGTQPHKPHFSDMDVNLVDTLEYAEYSFHMEKVKITYRLIYSLFDKIAYLLNDYLQIGLNRKKISFRSLWHEDVKGKKTLRQRFQNNTNIALRGLYWLSKDLYNAEDEEAHSIVLEPDAQELAEIRNHIEHKSFKVVQYGNWGGDDPDGYTYAIDRGKFELKTLKLISLMRSAIIYTSLAIHHEEKQNPKGPALPMPFPEYLFTDKV